jgi:hypothetical protein
MHNICMLGAIFDVFTAIVQNQPDICEIFKMMMGGNILALIKIEYRIRSLMPIASKYDLGTVFIKNFVISRFRDDVNGGNGHMIQSEHMKSC